MSHSKLTKADCQAAIKSLKTAGGIAAEAARRLKIPINTFKGRIDAAVGRFGFERREPSRIERVKLIEPATPAHIRNIAQLEQTVKDLRGQLGEMTKEQVSAHALREIIHGCADEPAKPPSWRFKQTSGHTTGIHLLFASDWHWDEFVNPAQNSGGNAYDHRIAVDRAKHCFGTFINFTTNHLSKPSYDYSTLALRHERIPDPRIGTFDHR